MTDETVRVNRKDVSEVKLKSGRFGDLFLIMRYDSGKKSEYFIAEPVDDMKRMIDMFNSDIS